MDTTAVHYGEGSQRAIECSSRKEQMRYPNQRQYSVNLCHVVKGARAAKGGKGGIAIICNHDWAADDALALASTATAIDRSVLDRGIGLEEAGLGWLECWKNAMSGNELLSSSLVSLSLN